MTSPQHIDVEVPVIEIEPGWAAEDCHTIQQCDDAFAILMARVATIEMQIDIANVGERRENSSLVWEAKAKGALKYARAALQIVDRRRAAILKAERAADSARFHNVFADVIREFEPKRFGEWFAEAKRRCGVSP